MIFFFFYFCTVHKVGVHHWGKNQRKFGCSDKTTYEIGLNSKSLLIFHYYVMPDDKMNIEGKKKKNMKLHKETQVLKTPIDLGIVKFLSSPMQASVINIPIKKRIATHNTTGFKE